MTSASLRPPPCRPFSLWTSNYRRRLRCSQLKSSCPTCFFNHAAYVLQTLHFVPSDSSARQHTRFPDMYATESAFVSLASERCDAVISGGSCRPLINAYFTNATPASWRRYRKTEWESKRDEETDRHLVFLNRDGMSLPLKNSVTA